MKSKQSKSANRLEIAPFPTEGKVRAKQAAKFLGIGTSTWWLYVSQQRIERPQKYGERVSVWNAEYVRQLAEAGIPKAPKREAVA